MKMKHIYTIVFILVSCQYGVAQNKNADNFISKLLSENVQYFENAKLNDNGTLEIQVNDSVYSSIDPSRKSIILEVALKKWDGEIFFIHSGYNREIWKKDIKTGQVSLVGQWNLNDPEIYKYLPKMLQTTKFHPWFFYIGGQSSFNSDYTNVLLSARIGSFLLKDRWDLALSGSFSVNGNDINSMVTAEFGALSKVYFPIKKYNVSPYVGGGFSRVYTSSNMDIDMGMGMESTSVDNSYWNEMLLLGVSLYVGPGSLDFGLQFGKNFNVAIGYTFSF